jgi:hypothetical protein
MMARRDHEDKDEGLISCSCCGDGCKVRNFVKMFLPRVEWDN